VCLVGARIKHQTSAGAEIGAAWQPACGKGWCRRGEGECRGDNQSGEDAECDDSHAAMTPPHAAPHNRGGTLNLGRADPGIWAQGQAEMMRAFACANSWSVNIPCAFRSARSLSCCTLVGCAGGAGAGAAAGCW
jgi:hypothetical protein